MHQYNKHECSLLDTRKNKQRKQFTDGTAQLGSTVKPWSLRPEAVDELPN